jgi:hypothetical protein
MRIQRSDGSGRSYNLVHNGNLGNGSIPAYVDNAYELLDQPGEWYLDPSANTVYYIPRVTENMKNADHRIHDQRTWHHAGAGDRARLSVGRQRQRPVLRDRRTDQRRLVYIPGHRRQRRRRQPSGIGARHAQRVVIATG